MTDEEQLTPLQKTERYALVGNRMAIVRLVDALRKYRAIVQEISVDCDVDGEVDFALYEERCQDIESDGHG